MPVLITHAKLQTATPRFRDFGGVVGDVVEQRLNSPGNRYAIDVRVPPLREEPDGRIVAALLRQAVTQGARYPWPQPGFKTGSPGTPTVDGVVTAGSVIPMTGLTPGYAIKFGQFFSIIHDDQRYLYSAAEAAIADASGDVEVTTIEMLRWPLADGDTVELAKPYIEGLLTTGDLDWEVALERFVPFTFTISEQA